jgi:hypothetical protein
MHFKNELNEFHKALSNLVFQVPNAKHRKMIEQAKEALVKHFTQSLQK